MAYIPVQSGELERVRSVQTHFDVAVVITTHPETIFGGLESNEPSLGLRAVSIFELGEETAAVFSLVLVHIMDIWNKGLIEEAPV